MSVTPGTLYPLLCRQKMSTFIDGAAMAISKKPREAWYVRSLRAITREADLRVQELQEFLDTLERLLLSLLGIDRALAVALQ